MKTIYETTQLLQLYNSIYKTDTARRSDLCEEMAQTFVYHFERLYDHTTRLVHVFAGYGTNGAIALAVARLLSERRYRVRAYLFFNHGVLDPLCEEQRELIYNSGCDVSLVEVTREFRIPRLEAKEVIVDGLFGSDHVHRLEGSYVALIKRLNQSQLPIVSIDLPSGVFADFNTDENLSVAVRATHTVAFGSPRLSMFLTETQANIGTWHILPLNIDPQHYESLSSHYYMLTAEDVSARRLVRQRHVSKADCGTAMVIGGSFARYGRVLLAAKAALRTGCGSVIAHAPLSVQGFLPLGVPEIEITGQDFNNLPYQLGRCQAVAVGVGSNHDVLTYDVLMQLLLEYPKPMILDDEALDLIHSHSDLMDVLPRGSILLYSLDRQRRCLGERVYMLETISRASEMAVRRGVTVVLKGVTTVICVPGGQVYFSALGHAALASVGCGDVFTGVVLALKAQGYDDESACLVACGICGTAAERFASRHSADSLMADDLVSYIGQALNEL